MKNRDLAWDNMRPRDDTYPTSATPASISDKVLFVKEGALIVNRNGDIVQVTSGNIKWDDSNSPLADINKGYIRAKYLGNQDDSLEYANQIRLVNEDEEKLAKSWTSPIKKYRIENSGQMLLISDMDI